MVDPFSNIDKWWPFFGAAAGAFMALSLERFRTLSPTGKIYTVIGGFLGTIFLGPLVIRVVPWLSSQAPDSQILGGFYFGLGVILMAVLPPIGDLTIAFVTKLAEKWMKRKEGNGA